MIRSSLHVLIIGGGLGGLCLAHGLRQAGISFALYERDTTPTIRRQGYRLHIDTRGETALRACLPPALFELFLATTSRMSQQITILNKQLKTLKTIGIPETKQETPTRFSTSVDRLTLREILLADLAGAVHFGKAFTHYEQSNDGLVSAYFGDGTRASGDVLIAADGVHSRVRQQLLPDTQPVDTGTRCIYGKTRLTSTARALLPHALLQGFTVVADKRVSLAMGLVEFLQQPQEAAARLAPAIQFHASGDYFMWSLNAARAQFASTDEELFGMSSQQLQQLVLNHIKSWHPDLRALIAAGETAETFPIAVRVSTPCEPWPSTSITLLGDAIHAMSPAGGSGANMALLDAHLLCQALTAVARGEKPLLAAITEYERVMLKAGFEAVRFSANGGVLGASNRTQRPWHLRLFPAVGKRSTK